MNLREYKNTLPHGEKLRWEQDLADDIDVVISTIWSYCAGKPPSPKNAKKIVKSKYVHKKVTLHDLRPDIW